MIKKTPTAPYKRASRAVLNAYINKPSDYPPIVREQSITPIENRFFIGDGRGPECRAESAHCLERLVPHLAYASGILSRLDIYS